MAEESFFEELLAAEDELIDDYVGGELTGDDLSRFERHFLCTHERQKKLRFAQALRRYARNETEAIARDPAPVADAPTWAARLRALWDTRPGALATAALAIVIIVGALWLYVPRTQSPQTFATLTLTLSAGNRADADQVGRVKLAPGADALRINLELPAPSATAARYRAELENIDGETEPLDVDARDARTVSAVISAARLARGRYALRLFAIGNDGAERRINGSYFFDIE